MVALLDNFYQSVILKDPRRNSVDRIDDMGLLEPVFCAKVQAVIADAAANGHQLKVIETYRSQARQEQLFHEGATQLQKVGVHGYGLAADLVFLKSDGSINWDADYSVLCHLGATHSLVSGFNWGDSTIKHSFVDPDHLQRINVSDQHGLFDGSWYPDPDYIAVLK